MTSNNGFCIWWLYLLTPFFFTVTLKHNQLQQLTVNDCLRLAQFFWTATFFSFTVTDLVLIYESLTSGLRMTNAEWRFTYEWIPNHSSYSTELWTLLSESSLMLRPMVSRPVSLRIKHPPGAYYQIFINVRQLRVCWYGALSLTRGRVCRLQLPLVLACAVILGSESRGTRDHILLSQIRDFFFCCLLLLARLRWRYSTPPPAFLTWVWVLCYDRRSAGQSILE
jgi:hypothetical protein